VGTFVWLVSLASPSTTSRKQSTAQAALIEISKVFDSFEIPYTKPTTLIPEAIYRGSEERTESPLVESVENLTSMLLGLAWK